MKISEITSELDLRHWLTEHSKFKIEWVEPNLYGSSTGGPDCKVMQYDLVIGLELKVFNETRNGIKCKVRPAQRRWHHSHMRHGGRSALLAFVNGTYKKVMGINRLILIRGDHIPLRDYAAHPDSGCPDGRLNYNLIGRCGLDDDRRSMYELKVCLFETYFWEKWR